MFRLRANEFDERRRSAGLAKQSAETAQNIRARAKKKQKLRKKIRAKQSAETVQSIRAKSSRMIYKSKTFAQTSLRNFDVKLRENYKNGTMSGKKVSDKTTPIT